MSPRTGRPLKGATKKDIDLQLRISKETSDKLKECSDALNVSRTEVIEQGIDIVHKKVFKKRK